MYHIAAAVDGFGPWSTFKTVNVDGAESVPHPCVTVSLSRGSDTHRPSHAISSSQRARLKAATARRVGRCMTRQYVLTRHADQGSLALQLMCVRKHLSMQARARYKSTERAGHCAGTRNVLKAAAQAGVPRLVHVSTEAVLVKGDTPISDADESTPVPDDPGFYAPYSKSKAMAERLVLVSRRSGNHG